MKTFLLFLLSLILLGSQSSFAQAGTIDLTFNPTDVGYAGEYGADAAVRASAIQKDGRILIGGEFSTYDGLSRNGIARLKPGGLVDESFNPGTGITGVYSYISIAVYALAVQTDGKIIVGGNFTGYNGIPMNNIARLNSDGSLDASFTAGTGADDIIYDVAIQQDGKIIIGGSFSNYNGVSRNKIARLNKDGSLDASFNLGTGIGGDYATVYALALQADNKIIAGGYFSDYNGTPRNNIARLNSNGSPDAGFVTGSGTDADVKSAVIQPDGKIIIAGNFYEYNGAWRNKIARLNPDGTVDTNFDAGDAAGDNVLNDVTIQNDGSIIAGGGSWSYWYGPYEDILIRLNGNGTNDPNFYPVWLRGNTYCLAVQSNGQILVGGTFDAITRGEINLHRVNSNGTPDASFDVSTGANSFVKSVIVQKDGKILISGGFTSFNGVAESQVARLKADGTPDTSFHVDDTLNVRSISLQNDGKIIAGTDYNNVRRFNSNGRLDTSFADVDLNGEVYSTAVQNDGKILAGGFNAIYSNSTFNSIIRLNANGTFDPSFNSTATQNRDGNAVYDIAIQDDNKILIVGAGWQQSSPSFEILRLNSDGSPDAGFLRGTGANGQIWKVVQNNGKIIIGGSFTIFNGKNINYLARLNTNGSLDSSFKSGSGPDSSVFGIAFQSDGKILIGGDFNSYNGVARNRIARLNSDGTLDTGFDPGNGANGQISAIAVQSDGKILIAGDFTAYNGTGRNRIARLNGIGNSTAYVSIAITSGTNPPCNGQPITFTASPVNGGSNPNYQWKVNGNTVGTNSPTYTSNTLISGQVVSCIMTSGLANADPATVTSNSITISEPFTPIASITLRTASNPSCAGQSLTFTATLVNGGSSPIYQWKVNGNNAGTNSPTFTTNSLTNGQVVTCVITSTLYCVVQATSNPITITVKSCPASAQPPDWVWAQKSVGVKDDYSWRMAKDKNGNLFVAGRFSGDSIQFGSVVLHAPGGGSFVVKYDVSGNVTWARSDAGNANSDAISIATDPAGNVYVGGTFFGPSLKFGNITLNRTLNDYSDTYLVKFDPAGNVIWAKSGTGDRWSVPWGLATDNSGNIYMTGAYWSTTMNFSGTLLDNANPWNYVSMFLVKYNPAGDVVWATRSESYSFATEPNGIAVDNTGNIFVTGYFKGSYYYYRDSLKFGNSTLYNNSSNTGECANYFIVKYDPSGNALWANSANDFIGIAQGWSVTTDKWGNAYAVGEFEGNNIRFANSVVLNLGLEDIFITKYDPSGNVKWARGLSSGGYDFSRAITTDNDGNIYIGASFTDGTISVGGVVYNNSKPGTSDMLVAKSDSAGNFLWAKPFGGNSYEVITGIVTDANKNIFITGFFNSSSVPFGCTTLSNTDSTLETSDFYVAKLGEIPVNIMPALSIDLTSGANSICQGQPVTFTATPTNGGTNPVYQWKIDGNNAGTNSPTYTTSTLTNGQVVTCMMTLTSAPACASQVTATSNPLTATCTPNRGAFPDNLDLQVYPNPANQNTMITFYLDTTSRVSIDVFNMAGYRIGIIGDKVFSSGNQTVPWNTSRVAGEAYFVRLRTGNYLTTKKVIVIH